MIPGAGVRTLGLGGLRETSYSLAALREALAAAERAGAETRLLAPHDLALPFYRPEYRSPADYGPGAAPLIEHLIEAARWVDGMIWASPAYHGAMSGAVKNALDFLQFLSKDEPSFLYGKAVGAIGVGRHDRGGQCGEPAGGNRPRAAGADVLAAGAGPGRLQDPRRRAVHRPADRPAAGPAGQGDGRAGGAVGRAERVAR